MQSRMAVFALGLLSLTTALPLRAAPPAADPDEQCLRDAGFRTDEAGLAEFWRQCAQTDQDWHRAKKLIRQLGDKDFAVRKKASDELVKLGPVADDLLREAMSAPDPEIARQATTCLSKLRGTQDHLDLPASDFGWKRCERAAALRLTARRELPLLVRVFVQELLSPEPDTPWGREAAERMLREAMKPLLGFSWGYEVRPAELAMVRAHSRAILQQLRSAAESPEESVRGQAGKALDRLGLARAKECLEALKQADGPQARAQAVRGLCNPLMAWRYTPVLLDHLKDENAEVRAAAAESLGHMVPEAGQAVPGLIVALKDADSEVRIKAAISLGWLESDAEAAIPALLVAVKSKDDGRLRRQTACVLGRVARKNPEAVMPALLEALQDKSARGGAAIGISFLGPAAEAAVEPLIAIARDPQDTALDDAGLVQQFAMLALGSIGSKAKAAVPMALELMQDKRLAGRHARYDAYMLLCQIGPEAEAAVPKLVEMVKKCDREGDEWLHAVHILKNVGPRAKAAAAALSAHVKDVQAPIRRREAAFEALEQIDPASAKEMRAMLPRKEPLQVPPDGPVPGPWPNR